MYKVEHKSELIHIYSYQTNQIIYSGKELNLSLYLSYKWDSWWCTWIYPDGRSFFFNDYNAGLYIAYDDYGRIYNLNNHKEESYVIYKRRMKRGIERRAFSRGYYVRKKIYKGVFRRSPVEGVTSRRGGPFQKNPKLKRVRTMYANPEYKDFNRGSRKEYVWGYKHRPYKDINWKSQRKTRHQWERKVK